MLQALTIRYLGPTNTLGSRFKVTASAGSKTYAYDYALNVGGNVLAVAMEYAGDKFNLPVVSIGNLANGDYCATLSTLNK